MKKYKKGMLIIMVLVVMCFFMSFFISCNKGDSRTAINNSNNANNNNNNNNNNSNSKSNSIAGSVPETKKTEGSYEKRYMEGYNAFHDGRYKEAIDIESEVIGKDPDNYKAYSIKGIALCFAGNFNDGMAQIDAGLKIAPSYGYGRFNKALAYELYGRFDEALTWYNKALEVEDYVWTYYGIASIYGRRGDVDNTIKYLKVAANMDPGVKTLAKEEKDFNNVRNSDKFKECVK